MLHLINKRLTSPESALLLRDLFHKAYCPPESSNIETVFGASVRRQNENIDDFLSFQTFFDEYIEFDIKKFFGLTIAEFFDLTLYEKDALINKAISHMKKINEEMKRMKAEVGDGVDDLSLDNFGMGD